MIRVKSAAYVMASDFISDETYNKILETDFITTDGQNLVIMHDHYFEKYIVPLLLIEEKNIWINKIPAGMYIGF